MPEMEKGRGKAGEGWGRGWAGWAGEKRGVAAGLGPVGPDEQLRREGGMRLGIS